MTELITTDLVTLGADWGADKHDVIRALAAVVDAAGRATDRDQLIEDAFARESTSATGLPGGIAIPHCRTTGVEVPTLAFARLSPGVDFGAKDGAADLAFLIAAPAGGDASHLKLLAKLARALVKKEFTDSLRAATTPAEVVQLVSGVVGDEDGGGDGSQCARLAQSYASQCLSLCPARNPTILAPNILLSLSAPTTSLTSQVSTDSIPPTLSALVTLLVRARSRARTGVMAISKTLSSLS